MPRNGVSLMGFLFRKNEMYITSIDLISLQTSIEVWSRPHTEKKCIDGGERENGPRVRCCCCGETDVSGEEINLTLLHAGSSFFRFFSRRSQGVSEGGGCL